MINRDRLFGEFVIAVDPAMPEGTVILQQRGVTGMTYPPRHEVRRRGEARELVHVGALGLTKVIAVAQGQALPMWTVCEHCDGAVISERGETMCVPGGPWRPRPQWQATAAQRGGDVHATIEMLYEIDRLAERHRKADEVRAYGPPNRAHRTGGRVCRTSADAFPVHGPEPTFRIDTEALRAMMPSTEQLAREWRMTQQLRIERQLAEAVRDPRSVMRLTVSGYQGNDPVSPPEQGTGPSTGGDST